MMFFSYILYSKSLDVFYKGFSANLEQRLENHNQGYSEFTSRANDWVLVYSKEFSNKTDALKDEKRLKKLNHNSINLLINR